MIITATTNNFLTLRCTTFLQEEKHIVLQDLQQDWLLLLDFFLFEILQWTISHTAENMEQKIKIKPVMCSTLTLDFRVLRVKCLYTVYIYKKSLPHPPGWSLLPSDLGRLPEAWEYILYLFIRVSVKPLNFFFSVFFQHLRHLAQRRRSAPSLAFGKALGIPWSPIRCVPHPFLYPYV